MPQNCYRPNYDNAHKKLIAVLSMKQKLNIQAIIIIVITIKK